MSLHYGKWQGGRRLQMFRWNHRVSQWECSRCKIQCNFHFADVFEVFCVVATLKVQGWCFIHGWPGWCCQCPLVCPECSVPWSSMAPCSAPINTLDHWPPSPLTPPPCGHQQEMLLQPQTCDRCLTMFESQSLWHWRLYKWTNVEVFSLWVLCF